MRLDLYMKSGWKVSLTEFNFFDQVVQDIPPPIPLDTPMVLIKPQEECSTVEVYKVPAFNEQSSL